MASPSVPMPSSLPAAIPASALSLRLFRQLLLGFVLLAALLVAIVGRAPADVGGSVPSPTVQIGSNAGGSAASR